MKLDAKQKKIALAVAGGGGLALIVLLSRRGEPAAAEQQAADAAAYPGDPGPSTFADNGAATAEMSTTIAEGLGRVSTSLDDVVGGFNAQTDAINDLRSSQPNYDGRFAELGSAIAALASNPPAPAAPPARLAAAGRPAGQPRAVASRPQVNSKTKQPFTVQKAKGGGYVHVYKSGKRVHVDSLKPGQKVSRPAPKPPPPPPHKPPQKHKKKR